MLCDFAECVGVGVDVSEGVGDGEGAVLARLGARGYSLSAKVSNQRSSGETLIDIYIDLYIYDIYNFLYLGNLT